MSAYVDLSNGKHLPLIALENRIQDAQFLPETLSKQSEVQSVEISSQGKTNFGAKGSTEDNNKAADERVQNTT